MLKDYMGIADTKACVGLKCMLLQVYALLECIGLA